MESRKRKIDHESSTSAAKFLKRMSPEEVENQNEIHDQDPNQKALNPLFMFEILPLIFNCLDIYNLKKSRLVCKLWRFEGGKILLKNSNLKFYSFSEGGFFGEGKSAEPLEMFLNTTGTSGTFNSVINSHLEPDELNCFFPLLLERTKTLQLNRYGYSVYNATLVEFLSFFPNLQILHLDIWYEEDEDGGFSFETNLSLLTKLESLKEIRLKSQKPDSFPLINLLLNKKELAVKEIYLRKSESMFFKNYLESGCNWPIETLVLVLYSLSPEFLSTIQAFLEKISGSLKHLEWLFFEDCVRLDPLLVPWANNFLNPSAFTKLKSLNIKDGSCGLNGNVSWLLFTFALQLGNLKKLTLDKVPGDLEERIREWNDHPDAKGRTLESESLEELEILRWSKTVQSFIVFSRRLWPNLKSLWIEYPPDNLPTYFLISNWIGLERLDLKFETMEKSEANLWTSWFTGGEKSEDGNSSQDDANFTLKDLKDLKHFGLWEHWNFQPTRIASDFLVDNSLKFMTQLQSLHLANSNISPEVQKMLKEALGSNVHIEFEY